MRSNLFLLAFIGLLGALHLRAAELPLGDLVHDGPVTPEQISMYLPVKGELSSAATAAVRFKGADDKWIAAHPLHRIDVAHAQKSPADALADAFAGVITGLVPGAAYTVEVTVKLSDATAVKTLNVTTRALPEKAGAPTTTLAAGSTAQQILAAVNGAKPGDVIQLSNGMYTIEPLQLKVSGTAEKPVYFRGESRAGAILKCPKGSILKLLQVSDLVIENMTLEGSKADSGTAASSKGVDCWDGAQQARVTLRNLTLDGVDMGIIGWRNLEQFLIYDNTLNGNNVWTEEFIQSNKTWNDDGIRIPGLGNVAFNNTLTGFGDSFAVNSNCRNNGIHFYRNDVRMTGDDAYEGDYGVRNTTFYDNRIHNSATMTSFDPIHGGPAFVFRNIAINVGRSPYKFNSKNTGHFVYNNTIVRTDGWGSGKGWGWNQSNNGPQVSWAYRNNILIYRGAGNLMAMEAGGQNPVDFTHNAWFPDKSVWWTGTGGSYPNLAAAKAKLSPTKALFGAATQRHEGCVITESDPFADDIKLGENHLTQITTFYTPKLSDGSAPRGKGAPIPGITDGFTGDAPDMGAIITGVAIPQWGDRSNAK